MLFRDFLSNLKLGPWPLNFGKLILGLANLENLVERSKKHDIRNL